MTALLRGPAYRAALSEAHRELEGICERLAELRVRKERVEKAVTALRELVTPPSFLAPESQPALPAPGPEYEMQPSGHWQELTTDPLQRQINNALGMAALA